MIISQLGFAFVNGLISSLSACVYPLIPITTALFGAGQVSHWSKGLFLSFVYVVGMSLTYVALGIMAALGGSVFGAYMGNPSVILVFVAIFFLLGLGFLGVIPMPLPNFANTMQVKKSNSLWYPLVLGVFSGFIAAPCTAPLFGALLIEIAAHSSQESLWSPIAQALSFSLGMGLPFLLIGGFALRLPKPGNWLGAVKYFGAAVLFAAGFHYLEDLFAPFPAQNQVFWAIIGFLIFAVAIYWSRPTMSPEQKEKSKKIIDKKFSYVPLLLLSGFGLFLATSLFTTATSPLVSKTNEQDWQPTELVWMYNLEEAQAKAQLENKPILIDFYADWCVACHKMKEQLFPSSDFHKFISDNNILLLQLDFTETGEKEEQLIEKYMIPGLPALVFIHADGTMFHQVLGFRSKENTMQEFKKVSFNRQ